MLPWQYPTCAGVGGGGWNKGVFIALTAALFHKLTHDSSIVTNLVRESARFPSNQRKLSGEMLQQACFSALSKSAVWGPSQGHCPQSVVWGPSQGHCPQSAVWGPSQGHCPQSAVWGPVSLTLSSLSCLVKMWNILGFEMPRVVAIHETDCCLSTTTRFEMPWVVAINETDCSLSTTTRFEMPWVAAINETDCCLSTTNRFEMPRVVAINETDCCPSTTRP